jgi:hypothetical protein
MDIDLELQVRNRAYEIWESEGRPDGCDFEHWTRAKLELIPLANAEEMPAKAEVAVKTAAKKPDAKQPVAAKSRRKNARVSQMSLN